MRSFLGESLNKRGRQTKNFDYSQMAKFRIGQIFANFELAKFRQISNWPNFQTKNGSTEKKNFPFFERWPILDGSPSPALNGRELRFRFDENNSFRRRYRRLNKAGKPDRNGNRNIREYRTANPTVTPLRNTIFI